MGFKWKSVCLGGMFTRVRVKKVLQKVGKFMYVVKQKCTTLPPIKFGVLVRIINKKVYLHNDNKKEFFSKS
ncbi:hypothetical protein CUB97_09700 [Prevotella intermedia]|uniref:Uncharacterized protein n=1 Tax=Prevotella intermedia TaxID=28131 RepID=A0A2M8M380_PREIN|nr:hypothetical protein CUB97_09700 [Prevotella intermedia]